MNSSSKVEVKCLYSSAYAGSSVQSKAETMQYSLCRLPLTKMSEYGSDKNVEVLIQGLSSLTHHKEIYHYMEPNLSEKV